MDKPKEAIERLRELYKNGYAWDDCCKTILAYLGSIPDDAVCVVWPKDLTRERLEKMANTAHPIGEIPQALRALAAIAPVRKKRVAYLFERDDPLLGTVKAWQESPECIPPWRKVGGPFEIEE